MRPEKFRQHHFAVLLKDALSLNIWNSKESKLVGSFLLLNGKIIFIKQEEKRQDIFWGKRSSRTCGLPLHISMSPLEALVLLSYSIMVEDRALW